MFEMKIINCFYECFTDLNVWKVYALYQTYTTNQKINHLCFSMDNRRLYVFRVLNILGKLDYIEVNEVKTIRREITTQNNGCHISVRNRKINNRWQKRETYRHCSCSLGRNNNLPSKHVHLLLSIAAFSVKLQTFVAVTA